MEMAFLKVPMVLTLNPEARVRHVFFVVSLFALFGREILLILSREYYPFFRNEYVPMQTKTNKIIKRGRKKSRKKRQEARGVTESGQAHALDQKDTDLPYLPSKTLPAFRTTFRHI